MKSLVHRSARALGSNMSRPGRAAERTVRIIWISFAAIATGIALASLRETYAPLRHAWLARASGWLAATCLWGAMCVSPLAAALGRTRWKPSTAASTRVRRALGLAAASGAFIHACYSLAQVEGSLALVTELGWLRAGLFALICLLALAITSFGVVVRSLRLSGWKALHFLVFAAGFGVCSHALLGPFGQPLLELALLGSLLGLTGLRLLLMAAATRARKRV